MAQHTDTFLSAGEASCLCSAPARNDINRGIASVSRCPQLRSIVCSETWPRARAGAQPPYAAQVALAQDIF